MGLVFGNVGEVSEATHKLLDAMATSRVRVALPQTRLAWQEGCYEVRVRGGGGSSYSELY